MFEFLIKIRCKMELIFDIRKKGVVFEFLIERNIFVCINFYESINFMLSFFLL